MRARYLPATIRAGAIRASGRSHPAPIRAAAHRGERVWRRQFRAEWSRPSRVHHNFGPPPPVKPHLNSCIVSGLRYGGNYKHVFRPTRYSAKCHALAGRDQFARGSITSARPRRGATYQRCKPLNTRVVRVDRAERNLAVEIERKDQLITRPSAIFGARHTSLLPTASRRRELNCLGSGPSTSR